MFLFLQLFCLSLIIVKCVTRNCKKERHAKMTLLFQKMWLKKQRTLHATQASLTLWFLFVFLSDFCWLFIRYPACPDYCWKNLVFFWYFSWNGNGNSTDCRYISWWRKHEGNKNVYAFFVYDAVPFRLCILCSVLYFRPVHRSCFRSESFWHRKLSRIRRKNYKRFICVPLCAYTVFYLLSYHRKTPSGFFALRNERFNLSYSLMIKVLDL